MNRNGSTDGNRTLLIVIAVFCAITALGTIVGLGTWAYSWWQTSRLMDELVGSTADPADIATGTWSGPFEYPNGSDVDMTFSVVSSNPVSGSMSFESPSGGEPCVVSVHESARTNSTVTVTTKATRGPRNCADAGRWNIVVGTSELTGELVWSSEDSLVGSELTLEQ